MPFDETKGLKRFGQEGVAQSVCLRFVPLDCFIQLGTGNGKQPDRHFVPHLASASASGIALISPLR